MPIDRRQKNQNWSICDPAGFLYTNLKDAVAVAVLMDIRDELQQINRTLGCYRFQAIPTHLENITRAAKQTATHTGRIPTRSKK